MTFFRPLILVFLFSFFNNIGFSQEPTRCGTDEILEQQLLDPVFERSFNTLMDVMSNQSNRASSNETLTIPVVVHVFHDGDDYGTGTNIADEVIYDAIANLNAAFAGEPWHTAQGAPFVHPYSNSNIEFCLASIDPDGNPTNGITRQNPDTLDGYLTQGMVTTTLLAETYEHKLKELCYWPVQEYCNIYVVHKLNGGYSPLGFAYLPPNSSYYDGIVCHYQVFGYEEPWLLSNFNLNCTLMHEMGHYLGLLHTFSSTSSCGPETNCNAQGDKLCDTPPTTGSAGCGPWDCPDTMVENFMDYSNDDCMDRFSPDGVTRMRNQLLQWRAGLVDEDNLACGIPGGLDVKISNIIVPNVGCDPTMSDANYEIRNLGSDTLTETTINYYVNDQTGTLIWTGNLGFGEAEIVTIPDFNVGFGPVSITVEAVPIGDINNENDVATFEYDNYEGTFVDVEIDFDALPAGIDWNLYEVVDGVPVGEPIFEANYFTIGFNDLYSCGNETYTFCLPEGEYMVIVTDLFGNGMYYTGCSNGDGTDGDITITNGSDTLNYIDGNWGSEVELPFTVNLPCVLGDCPWDINGDHIVNAPDALILLQYFGLVQECSELDFDQDGVVGVGDILDFISVFGYNCITGEFQVSDGGEILRSLMDQYGIEIEENPIESVEYYTIHGAKLNFNDITSSGIYIVKTKYADGSYEVKKVIK